MESCVNGCKRVCTGEGLVLIASIATNVGGVVRYYFGQWPPFLAPRLLASSPPRLLRSSLRLSLVLCLLIVATVWF